MNLRAACKKLCAITKLRHIWQRLAAELQNESETPSLMESWETYDQCKLEAWVARRQFINDNWLEPCCTASARDFIIQDHGDGDVHLLSGGRFCVACAGTSGKVFIVDLNPTTPEMHQLCSPPRNDCSVVQSNTPFCEPAAVTSLALKSESKGCSKFRIAVDYAMVKYDRDSVSHLYLYDVEISDSPQPSAKSLSIELVTYIPPSLQGIGYRLLLSDRYLLRIMGNGDCLRVCMYPLINGTYSKECVVAQIEHRTYSLQLLPEDQLLVFDAHFLLIYDLKPMVEMFPSIDISTSMPISNTNSIPTPGTEIKVEAPTPSFHLAPLRKITLPRFSIDYFPSLHEKRHSIAYTNSTSIRLVVLLPDGFHGIEIPHDHSKLHEFYPLYMFDADAEDWQWVAVGISRGVICYEDGRVVNVSYDWGFGKHTIISKQVTLQEKLKKGEQMSQIYDYFMEDIGRCLLRTTLNYGGYCVVDICSSRFELL